ncbi:MAG: zinc ribbon domain-containing protein [Lachnospiraceae bacterium]|nr:zinc ribbon domain-containing protein [Lachnospiraceae bacterium]
MNVWTYWKCPSCGAIIRGDNRDCPNCATPVPAGTKYLMPDNPEVARAIENGTAYITSHEMVQDAVTQVSEEKKSDKANWVCEYCGYQNRFENTVCEGCGAPKEESKRDYFTPVPETPKPQQTAPVRRSSGRFKKLIPIIAVILFLIWLFTPVTRKTVVSGFEWMRSIAVDEYQLCHEDDWSLPSGASLTTTKQEIHHYDHVIDHYETKTRQVSEQVLDGYDTEYRDLGNGQAETVSVPRYRTEYRTETYEDPVYVDVPVYQTKYYYDIDRWITVSSIDTSGKDHDPKWGDSDLPESVASPVYGDRKLGSRSEEYYVIFKDKKGNEQKKEYSFSEWSDMKLNDAITYKSFRFSSKAL